MKTKYFLTLICPLGLSLLIALPVKATEEENLLPTLSNEVQAAQAELPVPAASPSYTLPGVGEDSYTLPGVGSSVSNEDVENSLEKQSQIDAQVKEEQQDEAARIANQTPPPQQTQEDLPTQVTYEQPLQQQPGESSPTQVTYEQPLQQQLDENQPQQVAVLPVKSEQAVKKIALNEVEFLCGEDGSVPATVAKIKDKNEFLVILWKSGAFKTAGYDDQTRCKQVSARFEAYNKSKSFAYITTGKLNGQSVICLTGKADGSCGDDSISLHQGLLFTIKPGESSDQALETLAIVLENKDGSEPKRFEQ